jgi:hypothetical protein
MYLSTVALNYRESTHFSHSALYPIFWRACPLAESPLAELALLQEALDHVYAHSVFQITVDLLHAPIYRSLDSKRFPASGPETPILRGVLYASACHPLHTIYPLPNSKLGRHPSDFGL